MSEGQGSYWEDYKKYYNALYDNEMSKADVSGDGKAWDEAERKKKEVQRVALMGELRNRVFNPQEIKLAESRLGINPVQVASGPPEIIHNLFLERKRTGLHLMQVRV